MTSSFITRGHVQESDAKIAVARLAEKLGTKNLGGVVCFASPNYDPVELAEGLRESFGSTPVIACTTAGEIGDGYLENSLSGIAFDASQFKFHIQELTHLSTWDTAKASAEIQSLASKIDVPTLEQGGGGVFGFFLIDGLSTLEESIIASVYRALDGISIIGGSAGDGLDFRETRVLVDGRFEKDSAVIALVASKLPFETFKLQHFVPSDVDMVITKADSRARKILEIDGGPAAEEYARCVGVTVEELNPAIFSKYPIMLQIGDDWYVRSISTKNDDGSLSLLCAIEDGLVLTVAKGVDFVETLRDKVEALETSFSKIHGTLGCDCILRRLEILEKNILAEVEQLTNRINMTGFSTYGEQFNSIHVNQTLTAVCIGER